jgi:hypothetical protein
VAGVITWWRNSQSGANAPWLNVSPRVSSLGNLSLGEPRIAAFQLTNHSGNRPVRLLGAADFCDAQGCASSAGLPRVIAPGSTYTLEVEYKGTETGRFVREFVVYTDCPAQEQIPLTITGEVGQIAARVAH